MNIELTYPLKGQHIVINGNTFRRIWSEYDDIVLWDRYDDACNEWKKLNPEHCKKLELLYNKTIDDDTTHQLEKILEFLKL